MKNKFFVQLFMTIILLRASTFLIHLQWSSKCEIASLHPGLKCLTLKLSNSSVKYLLFCKIFTFLYRRKRTPAKRCIVLTEIIIWEFWQLSSHPPLLKARPDPIPNQPNIFLFTLTWHKFLNISFHLEPWGRKLVFSVIGEISRGS